MQWTVCILSLGNTQTCFILPRPVNVRQEQTVKYKYIDTESADRTRIYSCVAYLKTL
jgi:hypothetical protein